MIDALLADYRLLDVGCGTGGFFRLLKNHRSITAIDFSKPMIDEAQTLAVEFGLRNIDYHCVKFEDFIPAEQFDAISLSGIFGWYQPWPASRDMLEKAAGMLRPGGLLVASYVPPRTFSHLG